MRRDMSWSQAGGRGEVVSQPPHQEECHVSQVASAPASPEALLTGVSLGALSAVLILFACGYGPGDVLRGLLPAALFIGVWFSSTWFMTRDTGRVLVVLRRGFILGAFQWAVLALQWTTDPSVQAGASSVPAAGRLGPTLLMRDASSVFFWACALGFVLCWLCTRSPYSELRTSRP